MFLDNYSVKNYSEMYNIEQKSDFIEISYSHTKNDSVENIIRLFIVIGKHERQLEKDFCDFTFNEVVNLFEINEWSKGNTFQHNKSILKQYVLWCNSLNLVDINSHPIILLKAEDISGSIKYSRQYIKDFDDLKGCLEYNYENADVNDASQFIYPKLVYCLSYLGFWVEEIRFMKQEHVRMFENTIRSPLDDNFVVTNVNDYIMDLIREGIDLVGITTKNRRGMYTKKYQQSDYLIRVKASKSSPDYTPVIEVYFNNMSSKFREYSRKLDPSDEYYNKGITTESIWFCGCCNRLYEREKNENIEKNLSEIISKECRISRDDANAISFMWADYLSWRKFYYGR